MARLGLALVLVIAASYNAEDIESRFVGTWRLVSWELRHNDGTATPLPFEGRAEGRIIYTSDGMMSAQLMGAGRPPCASPSIFSCTPEQLEAASRGYLGYSGSFTVEEDRGTVTHHVVIAFNPARVGTDQVRAFEFLSEDRLELKAVTDDATSVLLWERVKN